MAIAYFVLAESEGAALIAEGQRALLSEFRAEDAAGKVFDSNDYDGQVMLLNFWATWCEPCKTEIPWLNEINRRHDGRGVAVVGVARDVDGWNSVTPFLNAYDVNYKIVVPQSDLREKIAGLSILPTTIIVDRQGRIALIVRGMGSRILFTKAIDQLIRQR